MNRLSALVVFAMAAVPPATAEEPHRELGAHEHGRGTLNIAVEGTRVSMEFEVPGMDIVGFEHDARTPQQIAAINKGKKQLSAPLSLFNLPEAAGCKVGESTVALENDDHDHDKEAGAKGDSTKQDEHKHAEFHAQYILDCTSPAKLTRIEFGYFRVFAGAQKLVVNLTTPKGQSNFEVTRAKPSISLVGLL